MSAITPTAPELATCQDGRKGPTAPFYCRKIASLFGMDRREDVTDLSAEGCYLSQLPVRVSAPEGSLGRTLGFSRRTRSGRRCR
jgi:hypothetical protein